MKPVTLMEILPFEQYEILRPRLRPLFLAEKNRRRLEVGDHLTILFENGPTVWYQVEEMIRTERISDEAAIRHEIDTYNELLPRPGELTATLLLQYPDWAQRDTAVRELLGFERHVWICINDRREPARFDLRQMSAERVSAVQFVRFPLAGLDAAEFLALANAGKVAIEVDHPKMQARAAIAGALAEALSEDFAD
jgi:hypothetical protein